MAKIVENALLIYTDGSLCRKGLRGGYAIVFIHVDSIGQERTLAEHSPPGIRGTTNNRMELQACIDALKMSTDQECFETVSQVVIRSDSRYVVNHQRYALGCWRSQGWKNWQGRPIENADLWKEFVRARTKIRKRVDIQWVKGHGKGRTKDRYNDRADQLAKESAKSPLSRRVFRSSVRRKIAAAYTKRGSVTISGQQMVIYVVETEWMRVQKIWKYRYQVVTEERSDYLSMDWIFSRMQMRDGHYYEVQVNKSTAFPQVLEIVREVDVKELTSEEAVESPKTLER